MTTIMERVTKYLPKYSELPDANKRMAKMRPPYSYAAIHVIVNDYIYSIVRDEVEGYRWQKIDPTKELVSMFIYMGTDMRYLWDEQYQGTVPVGFGPVFTEMDYTMVDLLEESKNNA
jgi:hypothetical protein